MTPAMKQYNDIKSRHPDTILFFRMGDFYETFYEDAKITSEILNIALTSRDKGPNKTPMAGIPYHALNSYLPKMIKAGKKVAICEQMEDPKTTKGVVRRDIVKILTPGTFTEEVNKDNNYIISLYKKSGIGISLVDLSTGEFKLHLFDDFEKLTNFIQNTSPSEILILKNNSLPESFTSKFGNIITFLPDSNNESTQNPNSSSSLGLTEEDSMYISSSMMFNYLTETQKTSLSHLSRPRIENISEYVFLDASTVQNLELIENLHGGRENTLLSVLDKTKTAMGSRMMKSWILNPLRGKRKIQLRLDSIEELCEKTVILESIKEVLESISDMERISGKVGMGNANPRDLISLAQSIDKKKVFEDMMEELKGEYFMEIKDRLKNISFGGIQNEILNCINQESPLNIKEGGIINEGVNEELDRLRNASKEGKEWIRKLQSEEIEKTKVNSLKVKYNRVFGYYIEVPSAHSSKVPTEYIRKQTLVNAERFTTKRLQELEDIILNSSVKANELEYSIFEELRIKTSQFIPSIKEYANLIALLDTLLSLATVAKEQNFYKPNIIEEESFIHIEEGRHPVIEKNLSLNKFVPNDLHLDSSNQQLIILTGPNMIGKSTYMRQNALIILLSHIGSFVPAKRADIGIIDRMFTRVGASDNLAKGESTFMVEMNEVANILNNATKRSFVILDEVGRGTSTHDGVSIARAISEYIHEKIGCIGIFATHYHELLDLESEYERIKNYSVSVKEENNNIIFLRKVVKGGTDQSYGIHVASLAGLPEQVIKRAKMLLSNIKSTPAQKDNQPALFVEYSNPKFKKLKDRIEGINIENLTPLEALNELKRLKDEVENE